MMKNKNSNDQKILIINKSGFLGDDEEDERTTEIQANANGVQPLYPLEMEPQEKEETKINDNKSETGVPSLLPNGVTFNK